MPIGFRQRGLCIIPRYPSLGNKNGCFDIPLADFKCFLGNMRRHPGNPAHDPQGPVVQFGIVRPAIDHHPVMDMSKA